MSQYISHSEWEHFFTEEALTVEELLSAGDFLAFDQSKLRIALDNKILNWDKFKAWVSEHTLCASIKSDISPLQIKTLRNKYKENKKTYAHYEIWGNDLVPLETWNDSLIVLGLIPPDQLVSIPNAIFVLCPPYILDEIIGSKNQAEDNDTELSDSTNSDSLLQLEPSSSNLVNLDFSKLNMGSADKYINLDMTDPSYSVWNSVNTNHTDNSTLARKHFDAYVVLKILNGKTQIFKMDDDLAKEDLDSKVFNHDLNGKNVFSRVFKNGKTETIEMSNLDLNILDFKYVCITPLKLGAQILGFLVGFKLQETTDQDLRALEMIALQNAA